MKVPRRQLCKRRPRPKGLPAAWMRPEPEAGFALIEVMVAILLFGMLASAVLVTLTDSLHLSSDNRQRTVAANLAEKQLERLRQLAAVSVPDGTVKSTTDVGGHVFFIKQEATFAASPGSGATCGDPGGGQLSYKRVSVEVTWDNMRGTKPVHNDTLLRVGLNGLNPLTGHIPIQVRRNSGGAPLVAQPVTLTGPGGVTRTAVTDSNGCLVFAELAPAPTGYSVTTTTPGYKDPGGNASAVAGGIAVEASKTSPLTILLYDPVTTGQAVVSIVAPAGFGYPSPVNFPLTVNRGGVSSLTSGTGSSRTLANLSADSYRVWAGGCADSDPGAGGSTTFSVAAGGNATISVPLGGVSLVPVAAGPGNGNRSLYALSAGDGKCSPATYSLGNTKPSVSLNAALPTGTYIITDNSAGSNPPPGGWTTIYLRAGDPATTTNVRVN